MANAALDDDDVPTKRESHFNNQRSSLRSSTLSEESAHRPEPRSRTRSDLRRLHDFNLDLERLGLIGSLSMSNRQCATLLLVGGKASSTTAVATTITTSSREAASTLEAASATAESAATTTTAHAGNIGALWGNLDAATLEHALVENESLRD